MIPSEPLAVRDARVWDGERSLGVVAEVFAHDGSFVGVGPVAGKPAPGPTGSATTAPPRAAATREAPGTVEIDGTGLWLVPGIVDAHAHVAWNDFDASDRAARSSAERQRDTARTLQAMLAAGVTTARDAGGADRPVQERQRSGAAPGPRLELSVDLLDREKVDAAGGIGAAVSRVLEAGATWIKLVATGGVASPAGSQLQSAFSAAEFAEATRLAADAGARVMVHAWGGEAITLALEAGAASIEHGIFLTEEQARLGGERGATLVPTLHIYRLVQAMIAAGQLPASFAPRVAEAVQAHPAAVRRARDAGMAIALGSDFATPEQHGTNLAEISELRRAGLSADEALVAATSAGARLLAAPGTGTGTGTDQLDRAGRIAVGARADAVLLRADPSSPGAFAAPGDVVAVIQGGRVVHSAASPMTPPSLCTADSRRPHDRSTL